MESANASAEGLRKQISETEESLRKLKAQLHQFEFQEKSDSAKTVSLDEHKWPLSAEEYKRYGRQMIVPSVGIQGQLRLKAAKVLIIGAGGLGCPAAAYIAGAGVGTLGIVDGDVVETSNLHRQILHGTEKIRWKKVDSMIASLKSLNPNPAYVAHAEHISPQNSESIVKQYDLVLDCTDNPASRYLISDICILLQKTLISASALRTDGQLIVLNLPPLPAGAEGGPCYRCVFPKPPPADTVVSCGDGGIIGPVVGVMGVMQAVEAIKIITSGKIDSSAEVAGSGENTKQEPTLMLLFSANSSQPFRSVKLRSRRAGCFACSKDSQLSLESLTSGSVDYVLFCGFTSPTKILQPEERIEASQYSKVRSKQHILLDVRDKVQFDICHLDGSINVPFSNFQGGKEDVVDGSSWIPDSLPNDASVYVVCRLGNDSQVVTRKLKEAGLDARGKRYIGDVKGGFKAWKEQVDQSWPEY
ncbi:molybdenum cofactor synthesis protein-like protein [Calycina marina]|uniref:Adenylyltransferase and sulfurtransferase uba4 n=1 Tax=Calycina marina TaxID=1763456 RepID=A0A9P7Z0D9_9HELO|nr:molybdenum cofactor synthesis protein-like protein [Calycina marina]